MIVASKALSGIGQPVAIIIYDERLDVWTPGAHTGTFRGNQLAFAAGAKAVRDRAARRRAGQRPGPGGADRATASTCCAPTRGCGTCAAAGLMWGIELADPSRARAAAAWPSRSRRAACRRD